MKHYSVVLIVFGSPIPPSFIALSRTETEDDSFPLWVIITIVLSVSILLIITIITVIVIVLRCCQIQAQKREYSITNPSELCTIM